MSWLIECKERKGACHESISGVGLGIRELMKEIRKFPDYEILESTFNSVLVRHKNGRTLYIKHVVDEDSLKRAMDHAVGSK